VDLAAIAFYVLATVTILSGVLVVLARNPVHSVLFLIAAFVSAAGLLVMLSAEFLAMLLVVVYVGAVAVLFLFVVMMLDIDFARLREGFARYLPLGAVIAGVLAVEMILVSSAVASRGAAAVNRDVATPAADATNAEVIGRVLYTDYVLLFQAAGMVLLVAMIGAIVLTLRHRPYVKRQDIGRQVNRRRKDAIDVISVPSGQGVDL
jgi:NADH-quinone oxidoreductase subunit J